MKNHYHILGVRADATQDEIKKSYRQLARQYHPDRNPGKASLDKFIEIQQAYDILSDIQRRKIFDKFWSIHTTDDAEDLFIEREDVWVKQRFSWHILFAAVVILAATYLALRYCIR